MPETQFETELIESRAKAWKDRDGWRERALAAEAEALAWKQRAEAAEETVQSTLRSFELAQSRAEEWQERAELEADHRQVADKVLSKLRRAALAGQEPRETCATCGGRQVVKAPEGAPPPASCWEAYGELWTWCPYCLSEYPAPTPNTDRPCPHGIVPTSKVAPCFKCCESGRLAAEQEVERLRLALRYIKDYDRSQARAVFDIKRYAAGALVEGRSE